MLPLRSKSLWLGTVVLALSFGSAQSDEAIQAFVGEWDLRGTDTYIVIRNDNSVFHSKLGAGDIRHDNVNFFTVEYRGQHLECHYQIKKYQEDELSIVISMPTDHQDCQLGEMRRSPNQEKAAPAKKSEAEPEKGSAGSPPPNTQQPGQQPGSTFADCDGCPKMVVIGAGKFVMGSPVDEPGRRVSEGPAHEVALNTPFAVGQFAITRDEFSAFVAEANYTPSKGCFAESNGKWELSKDATYAAPPVFTQTGTHPVVCVSWKDAQAYVEWLSKKTNSQYRLLSEAEREYVTRASAFTPYWWGRTISPQQANYDTRQRQAQAATTAQKGRNKRGITISTESLGAAADAPQPPPSSPNWGTKDVNSFTANPWGLFNVHGNAGEWVQDCWNASYVGVPLDGSAASSGDCSKRVIRGGGWSYWPEDIRAAYRETTVADQKYFHVGFRVAKTLAAK
ncbi:MAG: SUMF1/EgtB/PvdO family nonheme iron enzyme [Hyphomicrobium sp.]|nr:SUMF1/EgtB/PvdO family nonheme iron enzyme [Hyphomicrobium sp.]